ncbi:hypothetical protein SNE40_019848 [Patella caerulea]|uniref:Uncharacterized protein n=1 Tax=Patella caerulea TaxID=87958 RepID=A0AAN8GDK1_PATCE
MDEKELYVIKTCKDGKPKFQILSLEEPNNSDAEGLKVALTSCMNKQGFIFNRSERQIGNGSDGAAVNNKAIAT